MTNTGGASSGGNDDKGVLGNPQSSPASPPPPPPPPASESLAAPVSETPPSPTTTPGIGISTGSGVGGSRFLRPPSARIANRLAIRGSTPASTGSSAVGGDGQPTTTVCTEIIVHPSASASDGGIRSVKADPTTVSNGIVANPSGSPGGICSVKADPTPISNGTVSNPRASPRGIGFVKADPTTANTGIGGSSSSRSFMVDANVPPRKRGSMLSACDGLSGGGGESPVRSVRPNVAQAPPPPPAPTPEPEPLIPLDQRRCSLCGKVYTTSKSMFGHMNAHPHRGWKGAYPPPVFNRDEEFTDVQVETKVEVAASDPAVRPVSPDATAEPAAAAAAEPVYLLPDLNLPPPPEDDE